MSLSIRQNPMHLSLFSAFCGIRSRVHAGQKDVYLLEWLGLPELPDIFTRPLGLFNSVSDGIIAGFRRLGDTDMIQFTAPTSGSSGGALLDRFGRLIGIVTVGFEGGQNLNLAVSYTAIGPFVRGFL